MMRLTKKLLFGIEAVLDIAYNSGSRPVQAASITKRQGIPKRYLEQVLQALVRAGILAGQRGPKGQAVGEVVPPYFSIKEAVFPFNKFPGVDVILGPEMRSTGEVMGIDRSLAFAFAKSQIAAGNALPVEPTRDAKDRGVFMSVRESDRDTLIEPARTLSRLGFTHYATDGTGGHLARHGVKATILQKIGAGARPNVLDLMANGQIGLVINTPTRTGWKTDEGRIRATAVKLNIPMITTATAAVEAARAIEAMRAGDWGVAALQDYTDTGDALVVDTKPRAEKSRV